jgi:hypothetical protein
MSASCLGYPCPKCDRDAEDAQDERENAGGEVETGMDRDYHYPREFGAALTRGGW